MGISLQNVTFNSTDPVALGHWWAKALGGTVLTENEGWFVVVSLGEGRTGLAFQKVEDVASGNRLHLDINVDDLKVSVTDLVAAGATHVEDHEMGGFPWTVLADPDGNLFCVAAHA